MSEYYCLSCGFICEREDGEELPRGDERCSHEFELTDPQSEGEEGRPRG